MNPLRQRHCRPYAADEPALDATTVRAHLALLHPDWALQPGPPAAIEREFMFTGFRQTIAFVNALAWIAERENHHPELRVGHHHCRVRYHTHSLDGLSDNDFICAARIDALVEPLPETHG